MTQNEGLMKFISETADCGDEMLLALMEHVRLQYLDIKGTWVSSKCIYQLSTSRWWTKLRRLILCLTETDDSDLDLALGALKYSPCLEQIEFNYGLKKLSVAPTCPNLKYFKDSEDTTSEECIEVIKSSNYGLEEIKLAGDPVSDELCQELEKCLNLKKIMFDRRCDILPKFKFLTELIFCGSIGATVQLATGIPPNSLPQVKKLILHCTISSPFAAACPNLVSLFLVEYFSDFAKKPVKANLAKAKLACDTLLEPFIQNCQNLEYVCFELMGYCLPKPTVNLILDKFLEFQKIKLLILAGLSPSSKKISEFARKSSSFRGVLADSVLSVRKETSMDEILSLLNDHKFAFLLPKHTLKCDRVVFI